MKRCIKCNEAKELTSFAKNKNTKDGLQTCCKPCQKLYRAKYRSAEKPSIDNLKCSKCSVTKDIKFFNKSAASPSGYHSWCKDCRLENYQENITENRNRFNSRRKERSKWFRDIKNGKPCLDCGKAYEPVCMDYDHINDDKIKGVSRMVLDNTPKDVIFKEIEKCELVCLLCHNKRTQHRFDIKTGNDKKYSKYEKRNIEIINDAKSVSCYICEETRELCNMQFDHKNPALKFKDICQLKKFKEETLRKEIAKCRVICALCHRRKSIIEQKIGAYSEPRMPVKKIYVNIEDEEKECRKCHEILSFSKFSANLKVKSKVSSWCKNCTNEYRRNKRAGVVTAQMSIEVNE